MKPPLLDSTERYILRNQTGTFWAYAIKAFLWESRFKRRVGRLLRRINPHFGKRE